jgi:hypothetical protein
MGIISADGLRNISTPKQAAKVAPQAAGTPFFIIPTPEACTFPDCQLI